MMRPRGFTVGLVMAVIAIIAALSGVVMVRLGERRGSMRAELRRTQALWLARSAAEQKRALSRQVAVDGETAVVSARVAGGRVSAQASFSRWGTARVEAEGGKSWQERWDSSR
jgi:type II secretory pathway pseudopilin PulG